MKNYRMIILAVLLTMVCRTVADNLTVETIKMSAGETKQVAIVLNNPTHQYAAFQFDLVLPEGICIAENDKGEFIASLNENRKDDHTLNVSEMGANTYRFLAFSMTNTEFYGTDGTLVYITLQADDGISKGNKTAIIQSQVFTEVSGEQYKWSNNTFQITIEAVVVPITITAQSYTREYGEDNPTFEFTVTDGTISSGTPTITCSATKTSPVGTYDILIEKGTVSNNAVALVNGTLTIVQAPLTVTANSFTITQGDAMPVFTASYSGFRNGNTESVLTKQPKFTCSATSSSTPGTYDIIVSDAEARNYSMNYVKGTLTVIKKETTTPVEIADWPHDVIAENLPAGDYTDTALDNWDYVLYTSSAKASDALPIVNGLLTTSKGTAYAIDPSKKNSLVLKARNTPSTLNFTTPAKCEEIRLIAISAEGTASVEAVVNYVDGTNAPVYQFSVDDWYNTESGHGEAVYGFDRINRSSNEFGLIPYFRIFEFTISTDADKIVKGITFKNTSSAIPTILGIAKKGYDAPVEMCTVTYAVRYDGKVVATATEKVAKGNTLPVAPASLTNDFVTLTKSGTHPTTVTKDVTVYFTATWNGPFEFSKTLNDAKWYNLHIRSGYYVSRCMYQGCQFK